MTPPPYTGTATAPALVTVVQPAEPARKAVNPLEVAAAFRCVSLISNSIAAMPLYYERRRGDVFVPFAESPLYDMLTVEPNARQSAFDLVRAAVRRMLLDGVAYLLPVRDASGAVSSLELRAGSRDDLTGRYTLTPLDGDTLGGIVTVDEGEVIVLRYLSGDGIHTEVPGEYAAAALRLAREAEEESRARIADGGVPRVLISTEQTMLGTGQMVEEGLRSTAQALDYQSRVSRSRIIGLPPGVKAQQLGATSADLQLQPAREFVVRDICRFYGVPPSFVFSDSSSNYKSAEMAGVDFLTNTLDPMLRGIECELQRKLTPRKLRGRVRFRFDREARTAADLDSRARYLQTMQGTGAFTVNDIRRRQNLPPVAGGDMPLVSANLRTIGDAAGGDAAV